MTPVPSRNTASIPLSAGCNVCGSAKSRTTASYPAALACSDFLWERYAARGLWPSFLSSSRTAVPTVPPAPVTRIMIILLPSVCSRSECQPQTELDNTRGRGATDHADSRRHGDVACWISEVGAIQDVEELASELQVRLL